MDRQNLSAYYAANVGLVHDVAQKGYARLVAIGAPLDYEDLFQELTEIFIKSYDKFDESRGCKFSTYYVFSAFNQVNKMAKKFEVERCELGTRSIEEMDDRASEDGLSVLEKIDSGFATPEQYVEAMQMARSVVSGLSPMASTIAGMLIDPPAFMEREVEAAIAHSGYARSKNVARRARQQLDIGLVCSVIEKATNAPHSMVTKARRELEAAFEGLSND